MAAPLDITGPPGLCWQDAPTRTDTPWPRVPNPQEAAPDAGEPEWIPAAQAGDPDARAKLVNAYWDRLYRWMFHLTRDRHRAEDLTQETFLKALAALKTFRAGSNFRAWLFRIGHNNFVNLKRSERRNRVSLPDDVPAPPGVTAETALDDREALANVMAAIGELPPEFRSALMLHVQEGLAYRDVAKILNTTEETARWRVFKARQKLMKILAPDLVPGAANA